MNQHEITERRPLLDASGNLTEPGYAKSLLPVYRRGDIQANKLRIKEWDYYCINNGHFALALTIADNSYMGLDSISLLNLDEGWEITKSPMKAFTNGKVCPRAVNAAMYTAPGATTASSSRMRETAACSSRR